MKLEIPAIEFKEGYLASLKAYQTQGEHLDIDYSKRENNMEAYIESLKKSSQGEGLPEGLVPHTVWWAIEKGRYVGSVSVRHYLSEDLKKAGGHIGYDISLLERKKGYGTEVLKRALEKAQGMGIERALVTCDSDNIASRKIIERNGGVFENEVDNGAGNPTKLRFWVDIK